MRKLVLGVSLLLGACSDGGKLADIAAKLGIGGDRNCANAVSAETAAPQKAASDEAPAPAAVQPAPAQAQGLARLPAALPPPTSAEGRRLARMAAAAVEAPAETAAAAPAPEVELQPAAPVLVPVHSHHRRNAVAAPVAVRRKAPAVRRDSDENHDHFTESTAPSEYRLPVNAQVLVPREGQTVLNGPRHEGVPPPNTDPVRISQN